MKHRWPIWPFSDYLGIEWDDLILAISEASFEQNSIGPVCLKLFVWSKFAVKPKNSRFSAVLGCFATER